MEELVYMVRKYGVLKVANIAEANDIVEAAADQGYNFMVMKGWAGISVEDMDI